VSGSSQGDPATFAALVLSDPVRFAGHRIDIASDQRTGSEIAELLATACECDVVYRELPLDFIERRSRDLAAMFRYFGSVGLDIDITGLLQDYPEVGWHNLSDWLADRSVVFEHIGHV
jgi:hypothetical protein